MNTSRKGRKRASLWAELGRAQRAAERLYKSYPNVLGVSAGTKYAKRSATSNNAVIQFFVKKKVSRNRCEGGVLPVFVFGRHKDGTVNRRNRFETDVIEVGRIKITCGAGSPVSGEFGLTRQNGQATLIFRNKSAAGANQHYLISCAHVIGQIDGPSAFPVTVVSECAPAALPFAETIFSATQRDEVVDYDIALAEISAAALPLADLKIAGSDVTFRSFMASDKITPSRIVSCTLPKSNSKSGVIESRAGQILVDYRKGTYEVRNAWLLKASKRVKEGDSGGIIYDGDVAIGIVFASSGSAEGWAWFHPLEDAFDYLRRNANRELRCFP